MTQMDLGLRFRITKYPSKDGGCTYGVSVKRKWSLFWREIGRIRFYSFADYFSPYLYDTYQEASECIVRYCEDERKRREFKARKPEHYLVGGCPCVKDR